MNAIIIAAGKGTRLRPLTLETPKPLIDVLGKPMIERNIEYLIEKNINEIIVVVGYMKNEFEYLEKKYKEVKLIYNDKFEEYNNIYSFYLVRNFLENSYILDGDIYITENIFQKNLTTSKYFSKKIETKNEEWQLILENGKVKEILIGGQGNYIMSGISFFTKKDTKTLKELVEKYVKDEKKLKDYYWDHLVKENIEKFKIEVEKIDSKKIYEIDNLDELKELDIKYLNILKKVETVVILEKLENFKLYQEISKILGENLIEKNIKFLIKNGIKKIIFLTKNNIEFFNYLKVKYSEIEIIKANEEEGSYFMVTSLKDKIKEEFILMESNIVYDEEILKKLINSFEKNIVVVSSEKNLNNNYFVESKYNYLSRISKEKKELKNVQGELVEIFKISKELYLEILKQDVENLNYSYKSAISNCSLKIKTLKMYDLMYYKINTQNQLNFFKEVIYPRIIKKEEIERKNEIGEILLKRLKISEEKIENIDIIGGMTNRNYLIQVNQLKYVIRKPGEGTEKIISRKNEKKNATLVSGLKIDSELIFFDEESGLKISRYIENAETLSPKTAKNYLENVAMLLKKLHSSNIKFENNFDVFLEIEKYEKIVVDKKGKFYNGYFKYKKEILKLKQEIENLKIEKVPCHNDTVPENFIKSDKEFYLIDWEYSGMNDPIWDLAAFSLESNLNKKEEEKLISFYYNENVTKEIIKRMKVNKICQDFLWSIWTLIKELEGVSYGDYGIKRYKNAVRGIKELKKYE